MTPTDSAAPDPEEADLTGGEWFLRPATESDAPALAALQERSRRAARMPTEPRPVELVAADLAAGIGPDQLWVCEDGGAAVGYVRFVLPDASRVGWLDDLYVDPNRAGQGVGSALLALVKSWLPGGFGLWVFASNRGALAFYAAEGLRRAEHVAAADSPTGEDELRLAWSP